MKKAMSIMAVALMMAGSTAFACSGCGCEAKKTDKDSKEKTECCSKEKKQTACGETKKGEKAEIHLACGGSKKGDDGKKSA